MILSVVFPAFLAISRLAAAHPSEEMADVAVENPLDKRGAWVEADIVEHVVLKRGDVLTPRDLELAKRQGVDINEMFKHSVFKRADGDDYTIWVSNSFNETISAEEAEADIADLDARELERRQSARIVGSGWNTGEGFTQWCGPKGEEGTTHSNAPTTGGANAIISWADRVSGTFTLPGGCCRDPTRRTLVIGGSNGGTNIRFGAGLHPNDAGWATKISAKDIGAATRRARDRFQRQYNGQWKVQAHGFLRCPLGLGQIRPYHPGQWLTWVLHHTPTIV